MKMSLLKTTSALVLAAGAALGAQAQEAVDETELRAQTITVTATIMAAVRLQHMSARFRYMST